MNRLAIIVLTALFAVASCSAVTHAQEKKADKAPAKVAKKQRGGNVNAQLTLHRAGYHFRRHQEKAASAQLKLAISRIDRALESAEGETKENLLVAREALQKVADDLDAGKYADAHAFETAIAKAAFALGQWHHFKAEEELAKGHMREAGVNLLLAAELLDQSANEFYEELTSESQAAITKSKRSGRDNQPKEKRDAEEIGAELEGLSIVIRELGASLKEI